MNSLVYKKEITGKNIMYNCLYQNDDFILINKKQGVNFHYSDENDSLCEIIKQNEKIEPLLPVHRLDRITSGLLIFAKKPLVARQISLLFQKKEIEKYYIALSDKKPKKKQGMISGDMEKSRRGAWKLTRTKINPARTRFFSKACGNGLRLFILKPLTGKTHQIRVALKSIGAPVAGDPLYNRADSASYDRSYLHSYALRFRLHDRLFSFTTLPDEGSLFMDKAFKDSFKEYEEPWSLNWPTK